MLGSPFRSPWTILCSFIGNTAAHTSMMSLSIRQFGLITRSYRQDASATAIGACLAQHNDHMEEMPIAFFKKKLTWSQMQWSTIEREAFSVLEALRKFDTWIFGSQIQVISDHDPLTYINNSAPHGAKLTRWKLALQRYNVKVSYRRGSAHGNAETLSEILDLEFLSASSSDRCYSNGARNKTPLNHHARSTV
ncbi:retrovirus-related Pol polyprotein from transposon 297 [Trichonephila clavipes]|nr:retrovirus-related Pol polyprotein from transposon 297 [Trichonephila clavipes]